VSKIVARDWNVVPKIERNNKLPESYKQAKRKAYDE
jgi:hypothetical protein